MLTSAHAGDGKSSTAANLAVAAARVGMRTLLIDTDLRRPTLHKRFGLGHTTGLTDVLLTGEDLRDHVVTVGVDNLRLLPAGTLPPNPHELLASPAMRALEREVTRRADLVIYDSPAVLAVPDALELGRHVDVAILVGRAGTTGRRQLAAAIERMEQVGTEVAGTVLNDIDGSDGYYYSYYYAEENPSASAAEPTAEGRRRGLPGRRRKAAAEAAGAEAAGAVEASEFEDGQQREAEGSLFGER
jgi:polysaccharide biosynthesis transport protein